MVKLFIFNKMDTAIPAYINSTILLVLYLARFTAHINSLLSSASIIVLWFYYSRCRRASFERVEYHAECIYNFYNTIRLHFPGLTIFFLFAGFYQ